MKATENIKIYLKKMKFPAIIIIAFVGGFLLKGGIHNDNISQKNEIINLSEEPNILYWTCAMHTQIRQPEPGQCPICGMDLIPVTTESSENQLSPREIRLSPAAVKLAAIQVAPVERKFVRNEIRMVGKVVYDETRLGNITAWLPGRIDRLFVDYTGIKVNKGDHLVEIYSPELLTTQEELIQALTSADELKNSKLSTIRETAIRTVEASREKLRLLGMTQEQIGEFEKLGKPTDHVTIYSPMGGTVVHKNITEGLYVDIGSEIYTIADLSNVWILLDAYESDIEWIRYGQEVEFYTEAYPGKIFKGKIAFIDPVLNDKTRTVKIRVNVPNTGEELKPDMFVRAVVYSSVAYGGKVMDSSLSGKYICPMHPEIVKNNPGTCDICGMPLVKAESLGYANPRTDEPSLVIPASAPLITGKRAVVYISVPDKEGVYEGREVVLGPRAGDYYLITEGLSEGESVVVNGNFKIDSAAQILAKPSMMNPEGGIIPAAHNHGDMSETPAVTLAQAKEKETMQEHDQMGTMTQPAQVAGQKYKTQGAFLAQLDSVFAAYFHIQFALSHDNVSEAKNGAEHLQHALSNVNMLLLTGDAHMAWMKEMNLIKNSSTRISSSPEIATARDAFIDLSGSMINVVKMFGTSGKTKIYRFHCPMADSGKGADWLQNNSELENPFFGSSMPKCGELVETIPEGS